ncbi:phage shock protein PspE [Schaalia cardiffensis F0333]|uniref:Phage shock protein PspE n=1 Tax=Schaalia cardiffensis F0333 TaxID=888050 RepID=N6WB18_9ACTO|nr:rhodanese-like domain-containing protein [Schaalia cardiffensis]ENO17454.1 phage shock protein PspE [Schaalia cardiffensis F0333]
MTARRPSLVFFATLGALALVPALSACSSTPSESGSTASSASASVSSDSASSGSSSSSGSSGQANTAIGTLIDVRTPEEFADGHLKGATNIDFNGPDFAEKISELDKDGEYTLYCRSGRRSGLALEAMKAAGFTKVTNAGGVEQASKTLGLDIVKD